MTEGEDGARGGNEAASPSGGDGEAEGGAEAGADGAGGESEGGAEKGRKGGSGRGGGRGTGRCTNTIFIKDLYSMVEAFLAIFVVAAYFHSIRVKNVLMITWCIRSSM